MPQSIDSSEFKWINKRLIKENVLIHDLEVYSVLYFTFIWSCFEGNKKHSYPHNLNVNKLEKIVDDFDKRGKLVTVDNFKPILNYFNNRYVERGDTNNYFNDLWKHRDDKHKPFVQNILRGNVKCNSEIVLALAIIVYRLRCHLFHGVKSPSAIHNQVGSFSEANSFLMKLIDLIEA